jgi:hypothetical protein
MVKGNDMLTIVDELGVVNKAIADLEAIADKLKAEIKAQGKGTYAGTIYSAEVQEYDRTNVSIPLVRKFADEDLVKQCTVTQTVKSVVVTPLKA